MKKIALVTGANKGIGFHIAEQLARAGVKVLVGSRDAERGKEAAAKMTGDVTAVQIDVTDAGSIASAVAGIEALDILVNNAGICPSLDSPSRIGVDELRATFETNVAGVLATTNAFLPLLRKSTAPRIVNVSSELGTVRLIADPASPYARVNAGAYSASKAALNALTALYARELEGFKVNAVGPGLRDTDLRNDRGRHATAGAPAEGAVVAVKMALLGEDGPTGAFFNDKEERVAW